jgi:hypothetical protein
MLVIYNYYINIICYFALVCLRHFVSGVSNMYPLVGPFRLLNLQQHRGKRSLDAAEGTASTTARAQQRRVRVCHYTSTGPSTGTDLQMMNMVVCRWS